MLAQTVVFGQEANKPMSAEAEFIKPAKNYVLSATDETQLPIVNHDSKVKQNFSRALGVTVFSEDFSADPYSNGWTYSGSNGTSITNLWEYRGLVTVPDTGTGTRGAYGNNRRIESQTWQNGFMIFDSDFLDNNGVDGAFGTGQSPTPHTGLLLSPMIDLAGISSSILQFNTYARRFAGESFVYIGIDNGGGNITWVDTLGVHTDDNLDVNAVTDTDELITYYLPSVVANQQIRLGFYYDGATTAVNNLLGYYFWQIDDILVQEAPEYDLVAQNNFYKGATAAAGYDIWYEAVPEIHAVLDDLTMGATIENRGRLDQTNVVAETFFYWFDGTNFNIIDSVISSPADLVAGDTADYEATSTYNLGASGLGTYALVTEAAADQPEDVPNDNLIDEYIDVTANEYSWAVNSDIYYRFGGTLAGSRWNFCTAFQMNATDTLKSASFEPLWNPGEDYHPTTNDAFIVNVYSEADMNFNGATQEWTLNGLPVATSDFECNSIYSLQEVDTNVQEFINIPLKHSSATPAVTAGLYYMCVSTLNPSIYVGHNDERSAQNFWIGLSISAPEADYDPLVDPTSGVFGVWGIIPSFKLWTANAAFCDNANLSATVNVDNSAGTSADISTTGTTGGTAPYSYQWSGPNGYTACTGDIANVTTQGEYTLTVVDAFGCTSEVSATVQLTSVVENEINASINTYPNPAISDFNIALEEVEAGAYNITVRNMLGQVQVNNNVTINGSYFETIDIANFEAGIYFVEITNENNEKAVIRFVKQ